MKKVIIILGIIVTLIVAFFIWAILIDSNWLLGSSCNYDGTIIKNGVTIEINNQKITCERGKLVFD